MILEQHQIDIPVADGWTLDSVIYGGRNDVRDERVLLANSAEGYQVVRVWPDGIEKTFYSGGDNVTATEIYLFQARLMVLAAQGVAEPDSTTG